MDTELIIFNEYCQKSHTDPTFIISLEEGGLIEIRTVDGERYLLASQLRELERYSHLYYDLSINIEGIDAIHHMLERMERLQQEVSFLRRQLRRQLVQTAGALQHLAVVQMQQQRPTHHLAVHQLFQPDADDTAFAAQHHAVLRAAAALVQHRIQHLKKGLLPDGLELIVIGIHRIGLHRVFRRGGEENNLHIPVVFPDLTGGADAVFPRHDHVQQQHVRTKPLLHGRQQLQRAFKGMAFHRLIPRFPVFVQQRGDLPHHRDIIITKGNFYHSASPCFLPVLHRRRTRVRRLLSLYGVGHLSSRNGFSEKVPRFFYAPAKKCAILLPHQFKGGRAMHLFDHLHTVNTHRRLVRHYCWKLGLVWQSLTHDPR